jgi:hypothetical protein
LSEKDADDKKNKPDGQLISEEEREVGDVDIKVYGKYAAAAGT